MFYFCLISIDDFFAKTYNDDDASFRRKFTIVVERVGEANATAKVYDDLQRCYRVTRRVDNAVHDAKNAFRLTFIA